MGATQDALEKFSRCGRIDIDRSGVKATGTLAAAVSVTVGLGIVYFLAVPYWNAKAAQVDASVIQKVWPWIFLALVVAGLVNVAVAIRRLLRLKSALVITREQIEIRDGPAIPWNEVAGFERIRVKAGSTLSSINWDTGGRTKKVSLPLDLVIPSGDLVPFLVSCQNIALA